MYYLDRIRDRDGSQIYKTKSFYYPEERNRFGEYIVKSGTTLATCMSSDFFLEDADEWRNEAWQIIKERSDVRFFIITKRVHRIEKCLPSDWNEGYENVDIHITCENQKMADYRLPILLKLPLKHKSIACSPFLEEIHLGEYLENGQIDSVSCGGENYEGARECRFEWVETLRKDCEKHGVNFHFFETGTEFIKDNKKYHIPKKQIQSKMAFKSGISYQAKKIEYKLFDRLGLPISSDAYKPYFKDHCGECGSKSFCGGCTKCGRCENE
jgi:hypothetical protein